MRLLLNDILSSFSLALDLAEEKMFEHARRVAYISLCIADKLKLSQDYRKDVYFSALLHDVGASEGKIDLSGDVDYVKRHVEIGYDIAKIMPLNGDEIPNAILYSHENWDGTGPFEVRKDMIPLTAQIIHLADQFDIRYNRNINYIYQADQLVDWVVDNSEKMFSPYAVEAFKSAVKPDEFWLNYAFFNIKGILARMEPVEPVDLDINGLIDISRAFGMVIDNKSRFTLRHTQSIAELAYRMLSELDMDESKREMGVVAAYLHDLGKLAIPNSILEKNGKLTREEFLIIKSHAYYTRAILNEIEDLGDIIHWAANHHERLNGTGYPRQLTAFELDSIDRLIAVCDVFVALTEERPYREAMSYEQALSIMDEMVNNKEIDEFSVELLKRVV
ncbi:MAG: HD domain-containing protein [Thermoanaerobacteraceae bacterium]|nr:HD domain-containing protein [Thermoanaerobacteraceae bacterium]